MLSRLSVLSAVAVATGAGSLAAQIPARATPLQNNAPFLLVANPYPVQSDDSASAVLVGEGLRTRMRNVVGRDWQVVTRDRMNTALSNYGYPNDALLPTPAAARFARELTARYMVMSHMSRVEGGRYRLTSRLNGTFASNDMAGFVVQLTQSAGQQLKDLGEQAADALRPAIRALPDARECFELAATNQAKAVEAAQKAIRSVPNFGPAEFCLAAIAQKTDSTSQEALQHYQNAVQGDPMSIPSYAQIASIYFRRGDSAQVITTYQTMLQVDPLDQTLRENAFKIFQAFGRPSAAEEVADAGIARDPANTDWYDLKSNACLQQEKFDCAVRELERLFEVDSTRADTAFYSKINYAARLAEDTASYVRWAGKGVEKYPDHLGMLDDAARAYGWAGDAENTIAVTRRLLAIDPGNTEPLLRAIVLLGQSGRGEEIREFAETVRNSGDSDLQNAYANVAVNTSSRIFGTNSALADSLSQSALDVGATNQQLVGYANYFIGAHLFNDVRTMSTSVRETRQCEDARAYQAILQRARPALEQAPLSGSEQVTNASKQMLDAVVSEVGAVREMIGAFCR